PTELSTLSLHDALPISPKPTLFQRGSLRKVGRQWIAQWWEDGHRRKARWPVSRTTKSEAEAKLAEILVALNAGRTIGKPTPTFAEFVEYTYLPLHRGKWKISTAGDNEGRLKFHLSSVYASRTVDSFNRDEFQQLLTKKRLNIRIVWSLISADLAADFSHGRRGRLPGSES